MTFNFLKKIFRREPTRQKSLDALKKELQAIDQTQMIRVTGGRKKQSRIVLPTNRYGGPCSRIIPQ